MSALNRREVLIAAGAFSLGARAASAEEYIDLNWGDLVPQGQQVIPPIVQGLIQHDSTSLSSEQPPSSGVRTEWNGQIVRLPGYIVPIDYSGGGITAFILVPYVGACIHVPPPPANQLVFVTTAKPYAGSGIFEAVNVIGMFGTASTSTQIADVAYALSADDIQPY